LSESEIPDTRRTFKVAYFVSHPIQYQAPLLRLLSSDPLLDLTVFFLSSGSTRPYFDSGFSRMVAWDTPLLDGYRSVCLSGCELGSLSFWSPLRTDIWRILKAGRFDAVWVHGYVHNVHVQAMLAAKRYGAKLLVRGESQLALQTGEVGRLGRRLILPKLFRCVDGFLAIGSLNREFYLRNGVPASKIHHVPYTVDNRFFQREAQKASLRRDELRSELRFSASRPVILFVAKLQERKRPLDLLNAYAHMLGQPRTIVRPYLLIAGDGPQRDELTKQIAELMLEDDVRLLGFKNQNELPRLYDLCDVFVLVSEREPWGLVVNEVMNAGKPVILSAEVGCGPDLVREGENGFLVPVGDVKALSARLIEITQDPHRARTMGARSLELISSWGFAQDRCGLLAALRSTPLN
jgi:glycosyltransferase involved in cell wall biosynthesis